jgi:transposase-like protein
MRRVPATGEISAYFSEIYGASVSKDMVSRITDRVIAEMTQVARAPVGCGVRRGFIDAIVVKVRDGQVANRGGLRRDRGHRGRPQGCAGLVDGHRWRGKYWLRVLSEIKNRGTQDCLIVVCDGLKGLPEAIATVWPQTIVQTCIVHYADLRIMPTRQQAAVIVPVQQGG